MYIQKIFEETRVDVLHQFMCDHPMGSLTVLTAYGLESNHLPFELDAKSGPYGTLRFHVGRSNPFWKEFSSETDALAMFQGPNAYISPSWYVNGRKSGKVLPSWNYAVVHAYGKLRVIDDDAWLLRHLARLAESNEAGRSRPWRLEDAPVDFVRQAATGIIGLEIIINKLYGKWQVSQQRTADDRQSVAAALVEENKHWSQDLAAMIRQVDCRAKPESQ